MRVESNDMTQHIPVLLEEVKEGLHLENGMVVVDATLGGGSHTKMMLEQVLPGGKVIAIDVDQEAIDQFRDRAASDEFLKQALVQENLVLKQGNYSELATTLGDLHLECVDGILADLGFSSDQIESEERGFSFQENGPLDMRLNRGATLTAKAIVASYSFEALAQLLREYGDESEAVRIAQAIMRRRTESPIETTHDLTAIIVDAYPKRKGATMKIHPATKTFQALRIAVNQEFEHLERFLVQAVVALRPGGRLAVIAFHSGEDRRVKQFFRDRARGCVCPPDFPICQCGQVPQIRILTTRPIVAGEQECADNPRARSAKLRMIEKL